MKSAWLILLATALLALCGCSTTKPLPLTGDVMVDAPNAIANGPPRDKVLWQYRLAVADMRRGNYADAKKLLDDCILTLQGVYGKDAEARKSRSYFSKEARKTFIGEPYERSMAYFYRGVIYWMDGEPDNARACFRSAEFEDSDAEKQEYAGDWVLPDYLDGYITAELGGDGADALKRARANAKNIQLPDYNLKANVLLLLEFGPGPVKYRTGQYGEELRIRTRPSPVFSARVKVGNLVQPVAPCDDVNFQATTRGGRAMDHVLANKAVFKRTTDTVGNVALIGGLTTAAVSGNRTAQEVGLGIAAVGLVSKIVAAATTPEADIRAWDNLPQYVSFISLTMSAGQHQMTVEFLDARGNVVPTFTKNITLDIPASGPQKIVFLSDQSVTPQTL